MTETSEIAHLELLAQIDNLVGQLRRWVDEAPDWPAAHRCQTLIHRLLQRVDVLRLRLDAPLVVATLGGTGTGKSTLVNALVGREVCATGRQRPTTVRPVLIVPPGISAEMLGMDPRDVEVVPVDAPALRHLVLLDCPDPDTTELSQQGAEAPAETNLGRLRSLLPHCDVIVVTTTQQKYRSARVHAELLEAARGARLIFVQTHADVDDDIRADWQEQLEGEFEVGELLFVDALGALHDVQHGLSPRGDFARLMDLLTRELAGAAAHRIRRANFLELLDETLRRCRHYLEQALPAVERFAAALDAQRRDLAQRLTDRLARDLQAAHHAWEQRIRDEVVRRWGFSPFSLVLRLFHGLGHLVSGAWLVRVRTPVQLALWGVVETGRRLRRRRQGQVSPGAMAGSAARGWNEAQQIQAALVLDGYAQEAGLPRGELQPANFAAQAAAAAEAFLEAASAEVQELVARQAQRHTGWFTRWRYNAALLLVAVPILYRMGKNFFFDSWLGYELGWRSTREPLLGMEFFLQAAFWLLVWCALLVGLFSLRLRRGLRGEIRQLAEHWSRTRAPHDWFEPLEAHLRRVRQFDAAAQRLNQQVQQLRRSIALPTRRLGQKIA
jgi:hypothetical protein